MTQNRKMGIVSALCLLTAIIFLLTILMDIAKICFHEKPIWPPLLPILLAIFFLSILAFRKMAKTYEPGPIEHEVFKEMLRRKSDKQNRNKKSN
jgi:uncharacterized membrane protein YbaN (DUF454 family)